MFEVRARQLFPARPGSCARCATRAPGEPLAPRARAPSHPAGCVRPVSRRASSRPTQPLGRALRQAVRCELYNPSRRSRRPTSPGCVQRSASSRIRSRYSAVNWRRFGLATTSGSGVGLARPALGASSLRSTRRSFNVIESLSAVIGFHLHRPTFQRLPQWLAERGRATAGRSRSGGPSWTGSPASSTRSWRRTRIRTCRASSGTRRIGSSSGYGTSTGSPAATPS